MNTKSILSITAVTVALALFVAPLAVSSVSAFSFGDSIFQLFKQKASSSQSSQCIAGVNTANCNNVATNTNTNTGSQIAGIQN